MTVTVRDEPMGDVDAVVWGIEREPRLRTTIAALARFDGPLDRGAVRHRLERASRRIPRLRQRVVADPLGISTPMWTIDPEFRLAFHVRSTRLGGGGTDRDLLELVRDLIVQPFDRSRPLWEVTVIDGLHDATSALLLKTHHAVSDGVGGVELMLELFDLEAVAPSGRNELPPVPLAETSSATSVGAAVRHELETGLRTTAEWVGRAGAAAATDVIASARRLGEVLGSAGRLFRPDPAPCSPLMTGRSDGLDVHELAVDLEALRAAGRRVDGTINDAFVAAVAIGVADHHRRHDRDLDRLRVSIPINTRTGADGIGNHWTPGRVELPLDELDAVVMTARVSREIRRMRAEPGHALLDPLAGVLRRLPSAATSAAFATMSGGIDVAASNVPGPAVPFHLAGREVTALVPFGPLAGAAANITLMSHGATAHIGITTDPAAISDPAAFAGDLGAAFTSVVKGS